MNASGLDEVTSRLTDGLKACRNIVSDYRAMIGNESPARAQPEDPGEDTELR